MTDENRDRRGRFTIRGYHGPDIADLRPDPLSTQDEITSGVLARCPEAVAWTVQSVTSGTGHREFAPEIFIEFEDGSGIHSQLDARADRYDIELLSSLSFEMQPDALTHRVDVSGFKEGERESAAGGYRFIPATAPTWEQSLAGSVRAQHPDLLSLTIHTVPSDAGFEWAGAGIGRSARGKERRIDLEAHAHHLGSEDSGGRPLRAWSLSTIDLRQ